MIGRTVGHYHILERLGGGGMGVVYKAEDTKLGRMVALKFLPPELTRDAESKSRFLREARAASQLDHSNICTIYDIGESDDEQTFIAMACYEGETLKARIERGAMEVDEALKVAEQIARGLAAAHEAGIVHRDVKPANVMLTAKGVAKILDFGLAKLVGATHITQSKTTLGTLAYMAPEQLRGETVGPQADLWALGVVLFELLTGQRPFRGDYAQAISYSILNEQPTSLLELKPDAPAELERIVKKLLRKDPLQRYQTAEELWSELEALHRPGSGSGKAGAGAPKPREALRAGARLGPYEIAEPLGSGGMGDVYRARDTRLDRQVAVKVLAPEFSDDIERRQRFQREAKTISSLSHPNICTLFDVGEQEGTDYLVMEYLEGETLADRLTKGALPLADVLKIGIQIGEALGAAHKQGVIHRDLKPGNVMLTKTGAVKLVDFGLAKDLGAVTSTPRHVQSPHPQSHDKPLTAEGAIVGTLAYMAPEQVEGREADARTDIFALGAILYEMATGKRAFEGATKASLIVAILEKEPTLLAQTRGASETSERGLRSLATIEHVVRQCLEKDPEQRWQSATDVARELRWLGETRSDAEGSLGTLELRRGIRRKSVALAAVSSLCIASLGYAGWLILSAKQKHDEQPRTPGRVLTRLTWEPGIESSPSISPDGNSFVYATGGFQGQGEPLYAHADIMLRRIGGENAINLTKDCAVGDTEPAFSPDGQRIAFRSEREGGGIFVMGATGESVRRLTDFGYSPDWSPDGTSLVVSGQNPYARYFLPPYGLWVVDVATGRSARIFDKLAVQPSWSPSGRRIVFDGYDASGEHTIRTIPATGGDPVVVGTTSPAWSAECDWTVDGITFAKAVGTLWSLWRVRVDEETGVATGAPEEVLQSTTLTGAPGLSADRSRLLLESREIKVDLLRFDYDPEKKRLSGGEHELLRGPRALFDAQPSPDGLWLATTLYESGRSDLVLVSTVNGETRRLTNDEAREERGDWGPTGRYCFLSVGPKGPVVLSLKPDGSGLEQLTVAFADGNAAASWALPTSASRLAFVAVPRKGYFLATLDEGPIARDPKPLPSMGPGREFEPVSLSPDGAWALGCSLTASDPTGSRDYDDHLVLLDVRRETYSDLGAFDDIVAWDFCWMPDSRNVLVWHVGGGALQMLDRVTGKISPAGSLPEGLRDLAVSFDGRSLYGIRWTVGSDVWMIEQAK